MSFTEARLEQAVVELLGQQGYPHVLGRALVRAPHEVLIKEDLRAYLNKRYVADGITEAEVASVINRLERLPAADLYDSNRSIHKLVADGFLLKREDRSKKDLYVQLIDYAGLPEQQLTKIIRVTTIFPKPMIHNRPFIIFF